MRYAINFNKLVNRLVPHYMGGRNVILYLQALIKPLQDINDQFAEYAKETRIETSMTSQIFKFEWFLNRKFNKYFADGGQIVIQNSEHLGTPIYYGNASISLSEHMVMYYATENGETTTLYHQNETVNTSNVSFVVVSPAVDNSKITIEQYEKMLKYYIDKYRIFGKTYTIKYISNE